MALRIRLSRTGRKKKPSYRLVVTENTAPRDGRFTEQLGSYHPLLKCEDPNRVRFNVERIKYWISVGAKPMDTVLRLLKGIKALPEGPKEQNNSGK